MLLAPRFQLNGSVRHIPNGDAGAIATVAAMRSLVREYRRHPTIRAAALSITFTTPERDQPAEVEALFAFVRDHVRYVRDVHEIETIATPTKTLETRMGDCDDQAALLAALLESIGYPTRFVVASYNGSRRYSHVYLQALAGRQWLDMDPTEDRALGWAPPKPSRLWIERV